MDYNLTEDIGKYLSTPKEARDHKHGALMLLKLSGNRIMYKNVSSNPVRYADFIEHELQKYYNFRVASLTGHQVSDMMQRVEQLAPKYEAEHPAENKYQELRKGKRADHDSLPEDVRRLYEEIPELRARWRMVHAKLLTLSEDNVVCPDSERYPFVKELLELDDVIREKWRLYDEYNRENTAEDARALSRRALGSINLNKKKYEKNPTVELAAKMREWYGNVINPTQKLTDELRDLGIIE